MAQRQTRRGGAPRVVVVTRARREPRTWWPPGHGRVAVDGASGAVEAPGHGSRSSGTSGAVEAPGHGSRSSGAVEAPGHGGGTKARQPSLGRGGAHQGRARREPWAWWPTWARARWMAPAAQTSGAVLAHQRRSGRRHRGANLGPVEHASSSGSGRHGGSGTRARSTGAVVATSAPAAEPRAPCSVEGARGTAADSWGPWRGPRYGSSSGAVETLQRGAHLGHGHSGSHGANLGRGWRAPDTPAQSRGRCQDAAPFRRQWSDSHGANLGRGRATRSGSSRASGAAERQQRGSSPSAAAAAPGRGANLGPVERMGGAVEQRQRRQGAAAEPRAVEGASAPAAEPRARWRPPAARTLGRWSASAARSSDAVADRQRHQGAKLGPGEPTRARKQTRRKPRARGGASAARQPNLGRGGGDRGASGTRARQPSLGPVEATSGAVAPPGHGGGHQGAAAEPRRVGAYQGAAAAPGRGSRGSARWTQPRRGSGAGARREPRAGGCHQGTVEPGHGGAHQRCGGWRQGAAVPSGHGSQSSGAVKPAAAQSSGAVEQQQRRQPRREPRAGEAHQGRGSKHGANLGRGGGRQQRSSRASRQRRASRRSGSQGAALGLVGRTRARQWRQDAAAEARARQQTRREPRARRSRQRSGSGTSGAMEATREAASAARTSGAVEPAAARQQAPRKPRARWSASIAAAAPAHQQPKLGRGGAHQGKAVAPGRGANLGQWRPASGANLRRGKGTRARAEDRQRSDRHGANLGCGRGTRARQPKLGPDEGASGTRTRQPKLGRRGSRARASGPWSASAARWRPPGHGGGRQHTGSRSSGAGGTSSGGSGIRARQLKLGPHGGNQGVAAEAQAWWRSYQGSRRSSGTVETPGPGGGHQGAAAEARARWGHQGPVEATRARWRPPGRGSGSRASGPWSASPGQVSETIKTHLQDGGSGFLKQKLQACNALTSQNWPWPSRR